MPLLVGICFVDILYTNKYSIYSEKMIKKGEEIMAGIFANNTQTQQLSQRETLTNK
jgi:hypothetical protein